MRYILDEIRIHACLLEEGILLTKTSDVDEDTIESWRDQCTRSIDTLKRVLHNPLLTVPQKQSVTHAIGKIMSLKLTLGSTFKQGSGLSNNKGPRIQWTDAESAFKKRIRTSIITNLHHIDLKEFLKDASELFAKKIKETMRENQNASEINSVSSCRFTRNVNNDEDSQEVIVFKNFNTKNAEIEDFQEKDSGWSFGSIMNLQINNNRFKPMRSGGSYIPLPQFIQTKHSCINIMNNDDQCFKWAILAALHPVPRNNHPNWINHYIQYQEELNMEGISYPVKIHQMRDFENQNEISVNVFGLERNDIIPLYKTMEEEEKHCDLLLLEEEEETGDELLINSHYVLIKDLSRLVSSNLSRDKAKKYICHACLNYFPDASRLEDHKKLCDHMDECRIIVPKPGNDVIEFKNYNHKEKAPFVIYGDCKCLLKPIQVDGTEASDDSSSYTRLIHQHEICSIGLYLKCSFDDSLSRYEAHRGFQLINSAPIQPLRFFDLSDFVRYSN
ncbi:hypothetical protein QAD02_003264 [Eretmocerus hayati]|uniref:Uncharacterized protein n=1 Tax=Eretmocerus hayati TaxID=131215 RepID=A0ACC2NLE4_9HYME|nr:hypothetical protein QAD02_003264 [Eretmocerus hayati]